MTHPWFASAILLVIAANIITLAMFDPRSGDREGQNWTLSILEIVFVGVYWIELFVKVSALGFVSPRGRSTQAYLTDPWNRMDLIIVVVGTVETVIFLAEAEGGISLAALRAFRVLRVARAAELVPQLRLVVNTMYYAVPSIRAVGTLMMVYLLLFVTFGLYM
jgi:hypothetical protein